MPSDLKLLTESFRLATDPLAKALVVGWAKGSDPHPRDFPLFGSDYYGSSLNFEYEIRLEHPSLIVAEHEAVLALGPQFLWDRAKEETPLPGEPCDWCAGRFAPKGGGGDPSVFVCPKCFECESSDKLKRQRDLAGIPPAESRKPQSAKDRKSRRRESHRERP